MTDRRGFLGALLTAPLAGVGLSRAKAPRSDYTVSWRDGGVALEWTLTSDTAPVIQRATNFNRSYEDAWTANAAPGLLRKGDVITIRGVFR